MMASKWDKLRCWLLDLNVIDKEISDPSEIKRLDLSSNSLVSLPSDIGILSELIVLNLANNKLQSLPESLKDLKKLNNLDIRRNDFSVLPKVIAHMNIKSLIASSNRLTDVEPLSQIKSLRVVDLSSNKLKDIKALFCDENEVRSLNLASNYLQDISSLVSVLSYVERLNVSENILSSVPATVKRMQNIVDIDFSLNEINTIDEAFFDLPAESVNLCSNRITNITLHGLEDLEVLILDENPIQKIALKNGFAPFLKEFSCDGCEIDTFLPFTSKEIESLSYPSNSLTEIPEFIENYTKLIKLDLEDNKIVKLPNALANLTQLQTVYLKGNPLDDESKHIIEILHPDICDITMKTNITIEQATIEDVPQMADLLALLFAIEKDFEVDYEKQLQGVTKLLRHTGSTLLVAKDNKKVVGMVTMQELISSAAGDMVGQIEDLIVLPEYRKMGIGSRLINKIRYIALQENKYERVQLAADIDNDYALAFYTRRGFRKTNLAIFHQSH